MASSEQIKKNNPNQYIGWLAHFIWSQSTKLRFPVLRSYIRVYRTIQFPAVNRKKPKDDAENLYFLLVLTRERQRLLMESVTLDPRTIFTLRSEGSARNW